eukprot:TRINITY_DN22346_c0_g1_i2.p1 TRINITY_DN22346_c0_g1~~TRINITY_DN22346_c0_g1_i2.p1  ORF type:complete len:1225 (+),score=411.36 TRINITY_DN22346_c0_g1_i2:271-3945(+)
MIAWLKQRAKKSKEDKERKEREEADRERRRKEDEEERERAEREKEEQEKQRKAEEKAEQERKAEEAKQKADSKADPADAPAAEGPEEPKKEGWSREPQAGESAEGKQDGWEKNVKPSHEDPAHDSGEEDDAWKQGSPADDDDGAEGDAESASDSPHANLLADVAGAWGRGSTDDIPHEDHEEGEAQAAEAPAAEAAGPSEQQQEEKPAADTKKQVRDVPLSSTPSPEHLKLSFPVRKWNPGGKRHKAPRVWVVDHFEGMLQLLNGHDGAAKQEYTIRSLIQLEKTLADNRRMRLSFLGGDQHSMVFPSALDRERFYETVSAARPWIRVCAPGLVDGKDAVARISTAAAEIVTRTVPHPLKQGQTIDVDLTGDCEVRASADPDDNVSVWVGTLNSGGQPADMAWIPRGQHSLYVVCAQDCGEMKHPNRWVTQVCDHLGHDYIKLASMVQFDIAIVALVRKRHLMRVTNVEGSRVPTTHVSKCGPRGGACISLCYNNTSFCFLCCHLATDEEEDNSDMRKTNLNEVFSRAMVGMQDMDLLTQFHHLFIAGDLGSVLEVEKDQLQRFCGERKWKELHHLHDQLALQQIDEDLLPGFVEAPVDFAPTFADPAGKMQTAYRGRVLVRSTANAPITCNSYGPVGPATASGHAPVAAAYNVKCLRPRPACFMAEQTPRPEFQFKGINFVEWRGEPFDLPEVVIRSHVVDGQHRACGPKPATDLPMFLVDDLPQSVCAVTPSIPFLERHAIFLVFRDRAHGKAGKVYTETKESRKVDKGLRGTASLHLQDSILPLGQVHDRDIEIFHGGVAVGTAVVSYSVGDCGPAPLPALPASASGEPMQGITPVIVRVVEARGLPATVRPFCEVKLRAVKDGVVTGDHKHPQKHVTPALKGSDPAWDSAFLMKVGPEDAIRVSIFGKHSIGKEYLGKADLVMEDVLPSLQAGQPPRSFVERLGVTEQYRKCDVSGEVVVTVQVAPDDPAREDESLVRRISSKLMRKSSRCGPNEIRVVRATPQDPIGLKLAAAAAPAEKGKPLCTVSEVEKDGAVANAGGQWAEGKVVTHVDGRMVSATSDLQDFADGKTEFVLTLADPPEPPSTVRVHIVGAKGLSGNHPFCEIKLRSVVDGKVQADHKNPQKRVSKVLKSSDPQWDEAFCLRVRSDDAIRISVFSKAFMGKDYLGKVDLLMREALAMLQPGAPPMSVTHELTAAEGKKGKIAGELEVGLSLVDEPEQ